MSRLTDLLLKEKRTAEDDADLVREIEILEQVASETESVATKTFDGRVRFMRGLDIYTTGFAASDLSRGILFHTKNDAGVTGYVGLRSSANGVMSIGVDDDLATNNTATRIAFRHDLAGNAEDGAIFFSGNGSDIIGMINYDDTTTAETGLLMFDGTPGSTNIEHALYGGADGLVCIFNNAQRDIDFQFEGNTISDLLYLNAGTEQVIHGGFLNLKHVGELTIAAGVVTATGSYHTVDTQNDDATDNLDTINGGNDGDILVLKAANSARTVVVKNGTGNIRLNGDKSLDHTDARLTLIHDGTNWHQMAHGPNA